MASDPHPKPHLGLWLQHTEQEQEGRICQRVTYMNVHTNRMKIQIPLAREDHTVKLQRINLALLLTTPLCGRPDVQQTPKAQQEETAAST